MPPIETPSSRPTQQETISQSEVERLLAEVGGAGDSPPEDPGALANVGTQQVVVPERYDFHQASFFSARELRKLRVRHEEFIRSLTTRLSIYLRLEVTLQMSKLETVQFQKFTEGISAPTHLTLLKLEPLQGIGLLDLSPRLGLCIVDRELGGPGICTEDMRDLSQMETRLLGRVIEIMVGEWCAAWSDMMQLRATILGHENTGRFLQTSSPRSMMLILGIEARMGDLCEQMSFAFPYETIEPMMLKLNSGLESEKPALSQPAAPAKWNRRLDDVRVVVAAELPDVPFTAKTLARLKPGDVLHSYSDDKQDSRSPGEHAKIHSAPWHLRSALGPEARGPCKADASVNRLKEHPIAQFGRRMLFPIDKLEPGLVLSSDVLNSSNVALLVEGTRLTAHHLQLLKLKGIVAVEVEQGSVGGNTVFPVQRLPDALIEAAEQHVNFRLKHVPINRPALALIRQIAIRRTAEVLARKQQANPERP